MVCPVIRRRMKPPHSRGGVRSAAALVDRGERGRPSIEEPQERLHRAGWATQTSATYGGQLAYVPVIKCRRRAFCHSDFGCWYPAHRQRSATLLKVIIGEWMAGCLLGMYGLASRVTWQIRRLSSVPQAARQNRTFTHGRRHMMQVSIARSFSISAISGEVERALRGADPRNRWRNGP